MFNLLLYFFRKRLAIFVLPWLIHILIDIPTHSREFLPTPFLWPVSEWKFPGISWGNRYFMMFNYAAIIVCVGWIVFKEKKEKRPNKRFIKGKKKNKKKDF